MFWRASKISEKGRKRKKNSQRTDEQISHYLLHSHTFYEYYNNNKMNITLNTVLKINTIVGAAYASNVILMPAK